MHLWKFQLLTKRVRGRNITFSMSDPTEQNAKNYSPRMYQAGPKQVVDEWFSI